MAIRESRRTKRMSQADLAQAAGLGLGSLEGIENARTEATWGDLRRISYALDAPLADVISLAEELALEGAKAEHPSTGLR